MSWEKSSLIQWLEGRFDLAHHCLSKHTQSWQKISEQQLVIPCSVNVCLEHVVMRVSCTLGQRPFTGNVPSLALWVAGECGFNTAQHRGSKGDLLWYTPWALSHFNSMVMSCNHEDILLSKIIVTPLVIENWMWCHCKAFVSTHEVCARINVWEHFCYVGFIVCTFLLRGSFWIQMANMFLVCGLL